jgi:hypothetical protein
MYEKKTCTTNSDKEIGVSPDSPAPPQSWWCQTIGSPPYITYISIYSRWNVNSFKEFYVCGNEGFSNPVIAWFAGLQMQGVNKNFSIFRSLSMKVNYPDTENTVLWILLVLFLVC